MYLFVCSASFSMYIVFVLYNLYLLWLNCTNVFLYLKKFIEIQHIVKILFFFSVSRNKQAWYTVGQTGLFGVWCFSVWCRALATHDQPLGGNVHQLSMFPLRFQQIILK